MIGRGRKRRRSDLEGVNLLDVCPIRQADWREEDERATLTRRHPKARGKRGLAARLDHWLGTPHLKLDRTGTFAWTRFDGRTTVRDVAAALRQEYGESAEPVEQRLGAFVRLLHREGLVSYRDLDG
jgi:hypothetical protein